MKDERLGLLLIASSLLVILVISGLLVQAQLDARREHNRAQGVGLARLLSSIPYAQLVPGRAQPGPLEIVRTSQSDPDFAYAVVVDRGARVLAQVTAPGVIVPPASLTEAHRLLGEHTLLQSGRTIREFYAPVLSNGQPSAHVRIGFFEPGYAIVLEQASFIATLALPIFLLTPLAYFLIRREVRPVSAACSQIQGLLDGRGFDQVQIQATGEMGRFIRRFNRFVALCEQRVHELEGRRTDAVAASKVLSYQKGRIESVLERLPFATLVLDETGAVTFANARLETVMGLAPEVALGRKPEEWCEQPEAVAFLSNYAGASPRLQRSESIELSPDASGDRRLALSAHPLSVGADSPGTLGTLVVIRDETEAAVAKRAQAGFVNHVAHELKSPLNVLAMYSESLLDERGESEEFRIEACNVIHDEVERLAMLVSTLLTIARIESGAVALDRQRVRLHDFLSDALESVSRAGAGSGLEFELDVPGDLSPIYVDKELLRVSINNLLTNATKYNREGGRVILSAEETADEIAIRVRDTGVGIHEEDLGRIFDKFYRSESDEVQKHAGHGLGLHLAREIALLHGADIALESTLEEGSRFSIVFRRTAALVKEQ